MSPKVSICVPNLNTRPFLEERFDTIFNQSLRDWELLVYDSYSDDGAWEYIQELATQDRRMRIWQGPREGTPGSWNPCIREAVGEYVYVATSDDAMSPDCLEKLVGALERNPDCDLAHCPLMIVDETGAPMPGLRWPECSAFGRGTAEFLNCQHVRRAPYDGLLHLTGHMVYQSITQLLIRRSLFSRIGYFEGRWGSIGDINWEMKAGLVANTVHVPDTWATFRVHSAQATGSVNFQSLEYVSRIEEMIQDALLTCESSLAAPVVAGLRSHWLHWAKEMRAYYSALCKRESVLRRRLYQCAQFVDGSAAGRYEVVRRVFGRPRWTDVAPAELRLWLESLGIGPVITREL